MYELVSKTGMRRLSSVALALLLLTLSLVLVLAPHVARAEGAEDDEEVQTLYYRPTANPVADRTVHVDVHKLDRDTHEYVKGAQLQILDKATGEVMIEWTSGEDKQQVNRILDVSDENETHVYILRELSAPEGFEKADDVEFIVKSVNFETKGEVLSGAETSDGEINAEFRNVEGDIETQAFVINLYDAESPSYNEVVETRTNSSTDTTSATSGESKKAEDKTTETKKSESLPKMSDDTPYSAIYVMGIFGAALLVAGYQLRRRREV